MISFGIHRVQDIEVEVRQFSDFTVLKLHVKTADQGTADIDLYCYGYDDGRHQTDLPMVPFNFHAALSKALNNRDWC